MKVPLYSDMDFVAFNSTSLLYLYAASGWVQIAFPRSMCNDNEVESDPIQWMSILSFSFWSGETSKAGSESRVLLLIDTPPLILF